MQVKSSHILLKGRNQQHEFQARVETRSGDDHAMANIQRVSSITRDDTWELMLDLEREFRYYSKLRDRYSKWYKVIRYLLLFGIVTEGMIIYFLAGYPLALWSAGGTGAFIIGFLTIFDASTNYAETSALLRVTAEDIDDVKTDAEHLWRDIEGDMVNHDEAERRYNELVSRWTRSTRRLSLPTHEKDNVQAAKESYSAVAERYAR